MSEVNFRFEDVDAEGAVVMFDYEGREAGLGWPTGLVKWFGANGYRTITKDEPSHVFGSSQFHVGQVHPIMQMFGGAEIEKADTAKTFSIDKADLEGYPEDLGDLEMYVGTKGDYTLITSTGPECRDQHEAGDSYVAAVAIKTEHLEQFFAGLAELY